MPKRRQLFGARFLFNRQLDRSPTIFQNPALSIYEVHFLEIIMFTIKIKTFFFYFTYSKRKIETITKEIESDLCET